MTNLKIIAKRNYGVTAYYPACAAAHAFADAMGTKTLTIHALKCAKRMGFEIVLDGDESIRLLLAA